MSKKTKFIKNEKLIITIATVAVALITVIAIGVGVITNSGVLLRSATAAKSEHFEVDNAMFSYLFYTEFIGEMEEYSEYYASYYGFDENKDLKKQNYDEKTTWFEYFVKMAKSRLMDMLLLAEAATQNGIVIDEDDNAYIKNEIELLETSAMLEGVSTKKYIADTYGKGVKQKDIENALKIILLANKQYEHLEESLEFTEQELNEYFEQNSKGYAKADIRKYTFSGDNAEQNAKRLEKAKTEDEYKQILTDILKESGKYTDSKITTLVDKTLIEGYEYSGLSELDDWVFGGATAGSAKTVLISGEYTVYMVVKPAYTDEYVTKNIRHILISADAQGSMAKASVKAKEVLAEFEQTDKSEAAFKELALKYNTDPGSYTSGGLYENVLKETYVEEFENWCFDESRNKGDYEIIKTTYGYHIMYFLGDGLLSWQAQIKQELATAKLNKVYDTYATQYKIEFFDQVMRDIPA